MVIKHVNYMSVLKGRPVIDIAGARGVPDPASPLIIHVEFEVSGEIQGTFFLKHTKDKCLKLGVTGWAKNTRRGTVFGQMQGVKQKVDEMALWLRLQGPPGCRVDSANFQHWKIIDSPEYSTFTICFS